MNSELNTLAHSHLKPTPLSWGMNASAVRAASEFSLDGACLSLWLSLPYPNLPHDTREWLDVRGKSKNHQCQYSGVGWGWGTEACLVSAGTSSQHTHLQSSSRDPGAARRRGSAPRVAALAQGAGSVLLLKVPHSFLRKNGH